MTDIDYLRGYLVDRAREVENLIDGMPDEKQRGYLALSKPHLALAALDRITAAAAEPDVAAREQAAELQERASRLVEGEVTSRVVRASDGGWVELQGDYLARMLAHLERLEAAVAALDLASLRVCPACEAVDVSDDEIRACPDEPCPLRAVLAVRGGAA